MKKVSLIAILILIINNVFGQTSRKGLIPFDTISQKYTYNKIIDVPDKSSNLLYDLGKKWLINKFHDEKFLIDQKDSKLADLGSFQVAVYIQAPTLKIPMNWVVIYDIITSYKDNKCKLEITSIKVSGNSNGTTNESTLEAYEKSVENGYKGKKRRMQDYLNLLFKEIDINIKKTITEFEENIKGTTKSKDW
jgi:hypothetical protein